MRSLTLDLAPISTNTIIDGEMPQHNKTLGTHLDQTDSGVTTPLTKGSAAVGGVRLIEWGSLALRTQDCRMKLPDGDGSVALGEGSIHYGRRIEIDLGKGHWHLSQVVRATPIDKNESVQRGYMNIQFCCLSLDFCTTNLVSISITNNTYYFLTTYRATEHSELNVHILSCRTRNIVVCVTQM